MDEAALLAGILPFQPVADTIQHMVAYKGAGSIGYRCRYTCIIDVLYNLLHRNAGKVGIRTVCVDRFIDDLPRPSVNFLQF